jgi:hypothetical protein
MSDTKLVPILVFGTRSYTCCSVVKALHDDGNSSSITTVNHNPTLNKHPTKAEKSSVEKKSKICKMKSRTGHRSFTSILLQRTTGCPIPGAFYGRTKGAADALVQAVNFGDAPSTISRTASSTQKFRGTLAYNSDPRSSPIVEMI